MDINKAKITRAVKRVCAGDGKAFETLYNLTSKQAYFTALKIVKSVHDAEDVLQESYITVLDRISALESPESFMSWFNMIVANKAKEMLRKNNRYVFVNDIAASNEGETAVFDSFDDGKDFFIPGEEIEKHELKEQVMKLIDGLSDEKRMVVLLYYYNDLSISQIAEAVGAKENTVKTRLHYAKKDLLCGIQEYEKNYGKLLGVVPVAIIIWALKSSSVTTSAVFVASGAASATFAAITAKSALLGSAAAKAATGGGFAAKIIGLTTVQKAVAAATTVAVVSTAAGTTVAMTNNNIKEKTTETVVFDISEVTVFEHNFDDEEETVIPVTDSKVALVTAGSSLSLLSEAAVSESKTAAVKAVSETRKVTVSESTSRFNNRKASLTRKETTLVASSTDAQKKQTQTYAEQGSSNKSVTEKTTAQPVATVKSETTTATRSAATEKSTSPSKAATKATTKSTTKNTTKPATSKPSSSDTGVTAAEPEATTEKIKSATVNIKITQSGKYADTVRVTLDSGKTFTFADAKSLVENKGYDTTFAEYSGDSLPLTAESDRTYNITVDVE